MPLYDYRCSTCGKTQETMLKLSELDTAIVPCPICSATMDRQISAPMVTGDLPGYDCPITGKWIEGRRAHIENLAKHGCRVYEPGETQDFIRRRAKEDERLEKAVEETVEKEIHAMPTAKRERLVAELERGVDTAVVRQ